MEKLLEETAQIKQINDEFYKALNAMFSGNVNPMISLWSHEDDVAYLGPQGGILIGWNQVLDAWTEQSEMKLEGKVEPHDFHYIIEKNMGISQGYEVGTNFINGKPQKIKIRAINIFRKENGQWKMILHQTDILPYLKK